MMKYISIFLVLAGFLYSCEKAEPTRDEIEYGADRTKAPTINKDSNVDTIEVFVGETYNWEIDIEAANGIDSIFMDNALHLSYGNGQLKYNTEIIGTMPNEPSHEITLMVKDEIGLETTRKLVLNRLVPYKSPYLIADFPNGGDENVKFLVANNSRRVKFPVYASRMIDYQNRNFAWADVKVKSDISPEMNIRYGSPGFNGQTSVESNTVTAININDWKELVDFGVKTPVNFADETDTRALRLNIFPRKWNIRTMIALDAPINQFLIDDIVAKKRKVIKIDVYVDTSDPSSHPYATDVNFSKYLTNYDLAKHSKVGLGMANTTKFWDFSTEFPEKNGQDYGMSTNITKINQWETLTFAYSSTAVDPEEYFVYTLGDMNHKEVDMFILVVSPADMKAASISNATYYFRNFRIEEKVATP